MEILKQKIIILIFFSIIVSHVSGQQVKFKFGNSSYNGKVKSVSIFEYNRLEDEKVSTPFNRVPKTYEEFDRQGKLICRISNSENKSSIINNDYDDLGNIRYRIQYRLPHLEELDAFLKKKTLYKEKTRLLMDLLKQDQSLKQDDHILEIEKFYYDNKTLSITRVSKRLLRPTYWKLDKLGNIIYQETYKIKNNSNERQIVERKYLDDKIIYEANGSLDDKIYKQFLYNEDGNLSNQLIFNSQAAMLQHHIYTYGENNEVLRIFDGKNKLVSEMIKEPTTELVTYTYSKIDKKGMVKTIKKETEYIDEFGNVTKREVKNIGFNKVYATEYLFEYY